MGMHDWTGVEAGIFHAFHHFWVSSIGAVLNNGLLPGGYYALLEQHAAAPEVAPQRYTAEQEAEYYRQKKSSIAIRHERGDRLVAVIDIFVPGNKANRHSLQAFVDKACESLEHRIHLLLVDPFPPGPRDPNGIHAAIWQEVEEVEFQLPVDKPLTLVAYECDLTTRAYIEPVAVGDVLPEMPLLLEPYGCVKVPLEVTYQTAYAVLPRRWQRVLEGSPA